MGYRDILLDIEKDNLKSVYLLFGSEMYLKDKIIVKVKDKYIDKSFETLNYVNIDGKNASHDDIINACETLPFMSEKKIVIVEELPLFKANSKESSSNKEDVISDYVINVSESTCLIFIVKEEKVDNRKKVIKNIKKVGRVIELERLKNEELDKWVIEEFKKHKKKINRNIVSYFLSGLSYLDRNTDKTLYDLENETNKVANYLGDREEVTKTDIDFTKPKSLENDIFKLIDYTSQKNTSMAIEMFNEMILSGEATQLVMHMIIRQMRLLLTSKLLNEKGYSMKVIGQKINVYHNFIIQKLLTQGRGFTEEELITGLKKCRDTDRDIKTGKIDAKLGMEMLIVELSQKYKYYK